MSNIAIDAVALIRDSDADVYETGVNNRVNRLTASHHKDQEMWDLWDAGEELAAPYEWRGDAMSALVLESTDDDNANQTRPSEGGPTPEVEPNLNPDADTLNDLASGIIAREDAIKAVQEAAPSILLHWDIQGSALMLYTPDPAKIHVLSESGQISLGESHGARWRYQVGDERWIDIPDGSVIMRAWIPSPVSPWLAVANARVKTIARAIHLLTSAIESTARSRTQMRDVILVKGQPRATRINRDGVKSAPSTGMEGLRAALTADFSSTGQAVDAANVIVELLSDDDAIETISLAGTFDSRAIAMRSALVEALARSMPVPVQVTLGTEGSNDWSANVAERQAREIYMSAEARRMAYVACYLAGEVGTRCGISWKFDSLGELDALSAELGLDLSNDASRDEIMLHVMLLGMTRNMEFDRAQQWATAIADLWEARSNGRG